MSAASWTVGMSCLPNPRGRRGYCNMAGALLALPRIGKNDQDPIDAIPSQNFPQAFPRTKLHASPHRNCYRICIATRLDIHPKRRKQRIPLRLFYAQFTAKTPLFFVPHETLNTANCGRPPEFCAIIEPEPVRYRRRGKSARRPVEKNCDHHDRNRSHGHTDSERAHRNPARHGEGSGSLRIQMILSFSTLNQKHAAAINVDRCSIYQGPFGGSLCPALFTSACLRKSICRLGIASAHVAKNLLRVQPRPHAMQPLSWALH